MDLAKTTSINDTPYILLKLTNTNIREDKLPTAETQHSLKALHIASKPRA
jgi:hypothetical protein